MIDEWGQAYEQEMEALLVSIRLTDDFWKNVEPKFAAECTFSMYRDLLMRLPLLRQRLALQAVDASCWDSIKRRLPHWLHRWLVPHVRCFDITEVKTPDGKVTRYLLREEYVTQEEWLVKLAMGEEGRSSA